MIPEWREDYEIWGAFDCVVEEKGVTVFQENELLQAGGRLSVRSTYWSMHLASRRVRDAPRWSPSCPSSGWNVGASSLSDSAWYFDLAMVKLSRNVPVCVCFVLSSCGHVCEYFGSNPWFKPSGGLVLAGSLSGYRCILAGVHSQQSVVSGHRAQWRRAVPCGCQTETYTWILPAGLMAWGAQFLSALFLSVPLCFF